MSFKNDALLHKHQDCIDNIKKDIQETLDIEKANIFEGHQDEGNLKGWIEALEYALEVIDIKMAIIKEEK